MAKHAPNALINEKSPYLLQHAYNPVQWRPWGEKAFAEAREQDKPIFLSIGYATCHWCHVMERESFEDEEVAKLLNATCIPIKVDREERPDIDQIYMTVCQMMTGSGGWPLNVLLTPDRKPFFAATYIPKNDRYNRMGLMSLLPKIAQAWKDERERLVASSHEIVKAIQQTGDGDESDGVPGSEVLEIAHRMLRSRYDERHGGFGQSPKFPTPHNLVFLLRYAREAPDSNALEMVRHTLRQMRLGGIYDHVGFGFHRYATDQEWLVPHFEKMLYDQSLLVQAYTEAYEATGEPLFASTAHDVLTYMKRDLRSPEGGFYSAEDADSEGVEGKFYIWSSDEVRTILGDDATAFLRSYRFADEGNFLDESTHRRTGANIPHLDAPIPTPMEPAMEKARNALLAVREKRVRPLLDDKILADWNGLAIAAFARAAVTLETPAYAEDAARAADFVLTRMRADNGTLLHRYRDGEAGIGGMLDDYAFMIWGLLELYDATFDAGRLATALELAAIVEKDFAAKDGSFWMTADDAEALIIRTREFYDGACPSGNSVMACVLLRLAGLTGDPKYADAAHGVLQSNAAGIEQSPVAHTQALIALCAVHDTASEVVLVGKNEEAVAAMRDVLRANPSPYRSVLIKTPDRATALAKVASFTEPYPIEDKPAAYVCTAHVCKAPVHTAEDLATALKAGP